MKYCRLGRTGLYVSKLCLGTANFGTGKSSGKGHRFFTEQLVAAGVDQETAEQDACRIEHAISEESFQKLKDADVYKRQAMGLIRLVLCAVPALLLLTSKQFVKAVRYIAVFSVFYAVQVYVLPHLTGILNFLMLFRCV